LKTRVSIYAAAMIFSATLSGCAKKKVAMAPPAPIPSAPVKASPAPARAAVQPEPVKPASVAEQAPSRMPDDVTRGRIQELLSHIQDAYFDFNEHALRTDASAALQADAQELGGIVRQYPDLKLVVEGYCDERGSEEYNLALGDARAKRSEEYLVLLGLPAGQLQTISYGKDKSVCTEHNETCWQKNRRAHVAQAR
jgi:peptidoglycan-associated lipoprotein